MQKYLPSTIDEVQRLRALGKTYAEIKVALDMNIPKSTLSEWCKHVSLPTEYQVKVAELNKTNLHKGRAVALAVNKQKREDFLEALKKKNLSTSKKIHHISTAKIALAMLCLGEASKSSGGASTLSLGNSDPRIIILFLKLLKVCFLSFSLEKIRCTVQCRADQDIEELENFWQNVTHIPRRLFYKARVDPRTIGKPTKKKDYKGVLRVDYFDSKVWLELESLAELVYNEMILNGPEV